MSLDTKLLPNGPTPFPLGRHVEHDDRSRNFPAAMGVGPAATVFHRHRGASLDQGQLGSCVGNTGADLLMTAPLVRKTDHFTEGDARRFYALATKLDGIQGVWPPEDTGSTGLGLGKALRQLGLITAYHHCFGLEHLTGALQVTPVAVGVHWYHGMFTPDAEGIVDQLTGGVAGGHEFAILGHDVERDLYACLNHWANWGVRIAQAGIHSSGFWLPSAVLDRLLAEQGDAMVFTR